MDCDPADVAGMTGYAFMISVHEAICPSGPMVFDWGMLQIGINLLGRSTLCYTTSDCHTEKDRCDRTRKHCRFAYELDKREISEGRPCVI